MTVVHEAFPEAAKELSFVSQEKRRANSRVVIWLGMQMEMRHVGSGV